MAKAGLVLIMILAAHVAACAPVRRFEFARICMGVKTRVVLYAPDTARAERAAAAAFDEIARLDASFSDFRPDSELSRLSGLAGQASMHVSPELYDVLRTAQRISDASDGAFDVTVGPGTKAWRRARRQGELPTEAELMRVRELINWRNLALTSTSPARGGEAMLLRPGMSLDLGGIGKGYAAQRAVEHLTLLGYPRCLVSLAGDVVAGDPPPGSAGWKVEIRGERAEGDSLAVLLLRNAAASTAGDSEQFVEIAGRRYSHIVDPRSGLGSERRVMATVVAPRGEIADGLDTAACLLAAEEVERFIEGFEGAACLLAEQDRPARVIDPAGVLRWQRPPSAW